MKKSKSKPISNFSTIIQIAALIALSIHSANAQNSATRNLQYQRNDVMGKDSTNIVPNTQMGTVQNFTNTSTSSYTSPPPPPPPPPVNGACGASYGATVYSTPTALCSSGTPSAVSLSGNIYRWSCNGLYSGSSSSCVAYEYVPPPPPPPPTCQLDFSYSPLPPCTYYYPPSPTCVAGGGNIQWYDGSCGYKP